MMTEKDKEEKMAENTADQNKDSSEDTEKEENPVDENDGVDEIIEKAEKRYREISELRELCREFPELESLDDLSHLDEREKYEKLREKGFSVRRAFLASNSEMLFKSPSKSHMAPMLTKRQESPMSMSAEEYATVKAIFGDSMSDERIAELYKRIRK